MFEYVSGSQAIMAGYAFGPQQTCLDICSDIKLHVWKGVPISNVFRYVLGDKSKHVWICVWV